MLRKSCLCLQQSLPCLSSSLPCGRPISASRGSATMAASPAAVFEQVNDFHKWEAWSPWAKMDPNAKNTFEGPTSGDGAKFGWSGNSDVGEGNMEIVESRPDELVRIQLDFVRPMDGTNDVRVHSSSRGAIQTAVTWSMAGKNNFMGKAIGLFMDCEKMVGDQYEKGLANMKAIVEAKGGAERIHESRLQ